MKKSYKTVLIYTPVFKEDEVKKAIADYTKFVKEEEGEIVEEEFWGMRQLAYPIRKKTSGFYTVLEWKGTGAIVDQLELRFKRDVNVLRFLTVGLDKFSLDYYDRRRQGLVGRNKKKKAAAAASDEPKNDN